MSSQQVSSISEKISKWYIDHDRNKTSLLPQNLEDDLLRVLNEQAYLFLLGKESDEQGYLTILGLLLATEKDLSFKASRQDLQSAMKGYCFSVIMEQLKRHGFITIEKQFSLDDVLNYQFERSIKLTDFGRKNYKEVISKLAPLS